MPRPSRSLREWKAVMGKRSDDGKLKCSMCVMENEIGRQQGFGELKYGVSRVE